MIDIIAAESNPVKFFKENDLKKLQVQLHPDRFAGTDMEAKAKNVFARLQAAHTSFEKRVIVDGENLCKVGQGDLCNVYVSENGEEIVKVPYAKAISLVKREKKFLDEVTKDLSPKAITLFPELTKQTNSQLRFKYRKLESLLRLSQRKPDLDPRHLAWVTRRLLLSLWIIHDKGIIHGAITPEHVLIDAKEHGTVLIDWKHAGKAGEKIQAIPKKYKNFYEIAKNKSLSEDLDRNMLGKTLSLLINKDCPRLLRGFIKSLGLGGSSSNQALLEEFTQLLSQVFGPPKWVELES